MNFPSVKELKKLAAACRKAGISNFKYHQDGSYEFSLDPTAAVEEPKPRKSQAKQQFVPLNEPKEAFTADSLTEDELLFWSAGSPSESYLNKDESA